VEIHLIVGGLRSQYDVALVMWITPEEDFLLLNENKISLLVKPWCFATYLCRVPSEIILPSGGHKGERFWKKRLVLKQKREMNMYLHVTWSYKHFIHITDSMAYN